MPETRPYIPPGPPGKPCEACGVYVVLRVWKERRWKRLPEPVSPVLVQVHVCARDAATPGLAMAAGAERP